MGLSANRPVGAMDKIVLTQPALDALARSPQRAADANASPASAVSAVANDREPALIDAKPNTLVVQLDADAGRFIQTLTDPQTNETLRRFPSESQLAYARAVMAYLRALSES